MSRGWEEKTIELEDGREATIYIHPKAAQNVLYVQQEVDTAIRDIIWAMWEYGDAREELGACRKRRNRKAHTEAMRKSFDAEKAVKAILQKFFT